MKCSPTVFVSNYVSKSQHPYVTLICTYKKTAENLDFPPFFKGFIQETEHARELCTPQMFRLQEALESCLLQLFLECQ